MKAKNEELVNPVRLDSLLPCVMEDIKGRCNQYRRKHNLPLIKEPCGKVTTPSAFYKAKRKEQALTAVMDFMANNTKSKKRRYTAKRSDADGPILVSVA